MKRIITIYVTLIITVNVFAQAPEKMSYQAIVRDENYMLASSTIIGMQISILQGSENGTAVYVETQMPTSNANGLISLEIGTGTVISGDFTNINWSNGPYFIKTETDPSGGTCYSIIGTSQLLSVPYVFYASKARTSNGEGDFFHYIGEEYAGGIIFHLWKDNTGVEHGLIVSLTDLSSGQVWSNVYTQEIGENASSSWNGLSNSFAIILQQGHTNSAANLCLNFESGGYGDWYLPSIQELNMLWRNIYNVTRALSQIPGATLINKHEYWSSSENDWDNALCFFFDYGGAGINSKSMMNSVRAIRAF